LLDNHIHTKDTMKKLIELNHILEDAMATYPF